MESDSFLKDLFRSTLKSFFRVIGFGVAVLLLILFFAALMHSPPATTSTTSASVVPNHEWQQNPLSITTPTLLKINIQGVIGLDHLTQDNVRSQLVDTINGQIKQEQVKGVLLAVNSPGGTVDDADGIYRLILQYKEKLKVPVYAYIDGICASGGTYIACAADKIYSSDASIVGHVGVIMPTVFNFSGLMDHLGIQSKTIIAGKDKDALNPFRPWTANEGADFQTITDAFYQRFVHIVSSNRPKLTKEVLIAQGAVVYPAQQAVTLGYADGLLNTIDDAMKLMSTELGIDKDYQVVELKTKTWVEELFGSAQGRFSGKVEHYLRLPGDLHPSLHGKHLYLYWPQDNKK